MSVGSERVKAWRQRTKERLITAFGGMCCICKYNRHDGCLHFHHLDGTSKESSERDYRANPRSWPIIVAEMRKCVMVCNRCHVELHAGITEIPADAKRFDEAFADYKAMERDAKMDDCPVCGVKKPVHKITCSRACAGKHTGRVDWDAIDLPKLLEGRTYLAVADMLNVSDAAVHKRMQKLQKMKESQ